MSRIINQPVGRGSQSGELTPAKENHHLKSPPKARFLPQDYSSFVCGGSYHHVFAQFRVGVQPHLESAVAHGERRRSQRKWRTASPPPVRRREAHTTSRAARCTLTTLCMNRPALVVSRATARRRVPKKMTRPGQRAAKTNPIFRPVPWLAVWSAFGNGANAPTRKAEEL